MKVARAVGKGFIVTHKGWLVTFVLFIFYSIIRSIIAPSQEIEPHLRNMGEWGLILTVVAVSFLGLSYLWGGVLAFARDAVNEDRHRFKGFFSNCNRYFFRQTGIGLLVGIPLWILSVIFAGLLGGALSIAYKNLLAAVILGAASFVFFCLLAALAVLLSFSWTAVVADEAGIFKAIFKSLVFSAGRFFRIAGLLLLLFVIMVVISLLVWIAYAFFVQGLKRLGFDNFVLYFREFVGCVLYAYFLLFTASSLMAYYLNNGKAPHKTGAL